MSLPPPIFDRTNLPGGPWRAYRPRTRLAAVRVAGTFSIAHADGTVTTHADSWVSINPLTDAIEAHAADEFAAKYEDS